MKADQGSAASLSTRIRLRFCVRAWQMGHCIAAAMAFTQHALHATCRHGDTQGAAIVAALQTGHGRSMTAGSGAGGTLLLAAASTGRLDGRCAACTAPATPLAMLRTPGPLLDWCGRPVAAPGLAGPCCCSAAACKLPGCAAACRGST